VLLDTDCARSRLRFSKHLHRQVCGHVFVMSSARASMIVLCFQDLQELCFVTQLQLCKFCITCV
jgi:hypothetical protein